MNAHRKVTAAPALQAARKSVEEGAVRLGGGAAGPCCSPALQEARKSVEEGEGWGRGPAAQDACYQSLQAAKRCKSLLKKYLTKEVMDKCKTRKTKLGATLLDVIQSGVKNLDSGVGVYAPDAEAYSMFKELFDPLIEDYHNGFGPDKKQPAMYLGQDKISQLPDLDPQGLYVVSTRIRCSRSLQGYPFNPCLTEANYKEIEGNMKNLFEGIDVDELKGQYYSLDGMTKDVEKQLIDDHFLFKEGDRFLQDANACRYWPKGRGIFHNKNKTFLVWVNEEDHLRVISMQPGGNVGQVLDRLIKGANFISSKAPFSRDDRHGWLTFCPSNLGTTIRASVHVKIPKVSARPDFKKICDEMKLQIRGIHGEHSESAGGVYDILNKARLGLTEFQAVNQMYTGVKRLIELEVEETSSDSSSSDKIIAQAMGGGSGAAQASQAPPSAPPEAPSGQE